MTCNARSSKPGLLLATTLAIACAGEGGSVSEAPTEHTRRQPLVDLESCSPRNLALNAVGSGTPDPLESDASADGDLWRLLDGTTEYASQSDGVGFAASGTHHVTIDLGGLASVDRLTVWHAASGTTPGDSIPARAAVEIFDGSAWHAPFFNRTHDLDYPQPTTGFGSYPDIYSFDPIVASKLRWSYDGDWHNVLGLGYGGGPSMNDAVVVSTDGETSCAVRSNGSVWCWGSSIDGRLGNGSDDPTAIPVEVSGIANVVDLRQGYRHACALLADGQVACWGLNRVGQLGDGTRDNSSVPLLVPSVDEVVALDTGRNHTCALQQGGGVLCWGMGNLGQLGQGTAVSSVTPVSALLPSNTAIAIGVAAYYSCAVLAGGQVYCWGRLRADDEVSTVPTPIGIDDAVALSGGGSSSHMCALRNNGRLSCWGRNDFGQLGNGSFEDSSTPTPVNFADWVDVSVGDLVTCSLSSSQEVYCWGFRADGIPGVVPAHTAVPVHIPLQGAVSQVSTGSRIACARHIDGRVSCWGTDYAGGLGNGELRLSTTPLKVVEQATDISASLDHGCAVLADDSAVCWGNNDFAQLGTGDRQRVREPVPIPDFAGTVTRVAGGFNHDCAETSAGVECWGTNNRGQLGSGSTRRSDTPTRVLNLNGVTKLASGVLHHCVVHDGGKVACWGWNEDGQVGDGTKADRVSPVTVSGFEAGGASDVAAGQAHSCAIRDLGEVWCWGLGRDGRLGDNSEADALTPVRAGSLTDATQVVAGRAHSCALRAAGVVSCWGDNQFGQLGNGDFVDSFTPVAVPGLNDVASIATLQNHTCAVLEDRSLWCWGQNATGQVGDGSISNAVPSPVRVTGVSNVLVVETGGLHTCALVNAGDVWCWGGDVYGTLGQARHGLRIPPAGVRGFAGAPFESHLFQVSVNGCPEIAEGEDVGDPNAEIPAGTTVTTDSEGDGATLADPVETTVTAPESGPIVIEEGPVDTENPDGFTLLGLQVDITAPTGSLVDPLVLTFTLDASLIPPDATVDDIVVRRNDTPLPDCAIPNSAFPGACVASRKLVNGDVVITVLTTEASVWTFGVALDSDLDSDGTLDFYDECANTPAGEVVDSNGCAVSQRCPCAGPTHSSGAWNNHGQYVSCVSAAVNAFVADGLVSETEGAAIVSSAARSTCGME